MKTTEMQTHGAHLTLTHTSDLSLAEISKPITVQKLPVVQAALYGREGNTALQGMAAAVLVASMEATYTGMMKIITTLMENKIQFPMGTMIAILESIIAAEVMVTLMNLCFYLQIRHLLSIVMMEPARRYWECVTLYSSLYTLMMKTPAMPTPVLEIVPMVPATVIMNSISAIIVPDKKLTNLLNLVTELYDYT